MNVLPPSRKKEGSAANISAGYLNICFKYMTLLLTNIHYVIVLAPTEIPNL